MSTTGTDVVVTTPAGWYPAPHANNETRYWDGQQWLETPVTTLPADAQQAETQTPLGRPNPPRRGLAIAALTVGIAAFLLGLVPWLGLILAVGAVVLGIMAIVQKQPKGLAVTGTALGSIALITGIVMTVSFTAFLAGGSSSSADSAPRVAATDSAVEAKEPAEAEKQDAVEAAPPAADGTIGNPFPQPYVAKGLLGGEKYSLTARIVDANANALVEGWNQFNDDAPAGFKYVVVEITMSGIDPDGVEPSLTEWDLSLATSEGNQYSSEYVVLGDGMPSMSDGPTLYPGSTFTGYTAYIVPEAAQDFMLHDNGNYVSF